MPLLQLLPSIDSCSKWMVKAWLAPLGESGGIYDTSLSRIFTLIIEDWDYGSAGLAVGA
jgi:hypothetical protein